MSHFSCSLFLIATVDVYRWVGGDILHGNMSIDVTPYRKIIYLISDRGDVGIKGHTFLLWFTIPYC